MKTKIIVPIIALSLLAACASRESEYIEALPDRETVLVKIPEPASARGLAAGTSASAIVGEPADLYTASYYEARNLNLVVVSVIDLLEAIVKHPATTITETSATWGPFSDDREPNEFKLEIEKIAGLETHYVWRIAGKHKSAGDDAYAALASGSFVPEERPNGRGWFELDFETIRALNPAEDARGVVRFAFARSDDGVVVMAKYDGPNENGMEIAASYAYGENAAGDGFVVFAFPEDIDHGKDGRLAAEDVLIRTRWKSSGGRADIVARNGDLGADLAQGSQCWGASFVSTYEKIEVGGMFLVSAGDASTCVFEEARLPETKELPAARDVMNPYEPAAQRQQ